ncbi:MAG: mycofactocin biosynthesis chaperone MftB [SAR324 cluster bacterium]|nr:mycofactocin biosynthesis chaperone MftB [SAR324 cluster bacterium]MCZ6532099.1 mycofactocin biosynthesis chaperone MftB [SAR324 cluster bacterium]MCZ6557726.1 mycofactocin biosynthesis chaperone MftB [SAR324 cluster bacterium]MCZ6627337.1 mycofactocin biosynthesis chaperone MftB [SAR324 cluster bacterium]MCZ6647158.1 mycofactocin biosynthesis chaperone MftB [SAR324 cluster bacterium]
MDFSKCYRFARGFSLRRESFGGILYHYEGKRPDPRLYFIDSPFLIGLLELLEEGPLDELIAQVRAHFHLSDPQVASIREFLTTLASRGAFVAQ